MKLRLVRHRQSAHAHWGGGYRAGVLFDRPLVSDWLAWVAVLLLGNAVMTIITVSGPYIDSQNRFHNEGFDADATAVILIGWVCSVLVLGGLRSALRSRRHRGASRS